MAKSVDETLGEFSEGDLSVKIVNGIFGVVPFAPGFDFYNSLEAGVRRHDPSAGPEVIEKAREIAAGEDAAKALWVFGALDTADAGLGVYTGIKNVLSLFGGSSGPAKRTFEADPQQATDAALKATGLAYVIYRLFPGSVAEKVTAFKDLKAGQEAAIYFAVGEVALPFTDNVLEGGGNLINRILDARQTDMAAKFSQFAGAESLTQATEVVGQLSGQLNGYLEQAGQHVNPIMDKVKSYIPTAMNVGDSVTGAAATGMDMLPIWKFLGGRLVAEACAYRAVNGG